MDSIVVKIGDYKIARGSGVLVTYGLGSCLAVALYDPEVKIAGMGHIMLPKGDSARVSGNPGKFANLCISDMFSNLEENGCKVGRIVAKIAGGASMFDIHYNEGFPIGERNRESVMAELLKRGIPLIGEDTGGNHGRTVEFHIESGDMVVRSLRYGTRIL
jgi:chemotaxis protein CheD